MQRLSPLPHDVVGNVDDVVDGAHAGQREPALHPPGRGADLHTLDERSAVAIAQVGIGDLQIDLAGNGRAGRDHCWLGHVQWGIEYRGDLPRHADHGKAAGQVGGQVQVEHDVAHVIYQRHANRRICRQFHDPLVFIGYAEFPFGTDHAGRLDAAQFRWLEGDHPPGFGVTIDQSRSAQGDSDLHPRFAHPDIGCAGHHSDWLISAILDCRQRQAVSIGVLLDFDHFPDEYLVAVPLLADSLDRRDFQAGQGHLLGQFLH